MPKVSICIPTYKQVEYLRKTLISVKEQTFIDYELIVSDDSADDSVFNLLQDFDFKGKLKYFKNIPALGSPANWNFAITHATGEYIKILHHDDFFTSSESLAKYVKLLDQNPSSSFAFSGTEIELLSLKMKKTHRCSAKKIQKMVAYPETLLFSNYIGAPSATIFRNSKKILFDVKLKWLVDVDWYIQNIRNDSNIVASSEVLVCTIHGGVGQITQSIFADKEIQINEHVYLLNKIFNKITSRKKYSVFFQLLFNKYKIENENDLRAITLVPSQLESFFFEVFKLKNKAIFFKKVNYWLMKYTLSDFIFTIKKMFK